MVWLREECFSQKLQGSILVLNYILVHHIVASCAFKGVNAFIVTGHSQQASFWQVLSDIFDKDGAHRFVSINITVNNDQIRLFLPAKFQRLAGHCCMSDHLDLWDL